ncbi:MULTISPECIES: hypothetical protein [Streptomyces]|uniref:Uncharacterized protein n=1 Tax=Streptomyces lonegramiae TaxID=3075524 RepID=A0ABU2X7D1_9ACTN|nr:hypothetical protein [Streptomyces sp. DSM 41529]MDT0541391.1 hypothetical protein [Streptomyces sp. DSM 41529]
MVRDKRDVIHDVDLAQVKLHLGLRVEEPAQAYADGVRAGQ